MTITRRVVAEYGISRKAADGPPGRLYSVTMYDPPQEHHMQRTDTASSLSKQQPLHVETQEEEQQRLARQRADDARYFADHPEMLPASASVPNDATTNRKG